MRLTAHDVGLCELVLRGVSAFVFKGGNDGGVVVAVFAGGDMAGEAVTVAILPHAPTGSRWTPPCFMCLSCPVLFHLNALWPLRRPRYQSRA